MRGFSSFSRAVAPNHPAEPGAQAVHQGRASPPLLPPDTESLRPPAHRASCSALLSNPHSPPQSCCHSSYHSVCHSVLHSPSTPSLSGGSTSGGLTGGAMVYPRSRALCPGAQPPQQHFFCTIPPGNGAYRRRPAGNTPTSAPTSTSTTTTTSRAGALQGGAPAEGATRLLSACLPAALERALGFFGAFAAPAAAVVRWLELPGAAVVCVTAAGIAAVLLLAALVAVIVPTILALKSASFRLREALGASLGSVDREMEGYAKGAREDRATKLALPPQRQQSAPGPPKGHLRAHDASGPSRKIEGAPIGHLGGASRGGRSRSGSYGSGNKSRAPHAWQPAGAQGRGHRGQGAGVAPEPALTSPGSIAAAAERVAEQRAQRKAPAGEAARRHGLLGVLASAVGVVNLTIRVGRTGRRLWGSLQGFAWRGASWAFFWRRTNKKL